ncbi:hypothetical protein MEQU1_003382 [Malassezia equina]|uniref:Peptide hydrolase n=1 Tax=Malassezia equina TaxID=1381935 RepID=A0AAF0EFW0_9BASI|nr:hypothetical protein MEQU1_003382 [Malassezia equina]
MTEELSEFERQRQAKREPLTYARTPKPLVRELVGLLVAAVVLACITLGLHYRLPSPMAVTRPDAPRPSAPASAAWYDAFFENKLDAGRARMYEPAQTLDEVAPYEGPLSTYFSEANAMLTIQHLADNIGYRVVGTKQHVDAEAWLLDLLRRYEGVHATGPDYTTHVELFYQQGDGAHRFDILGHPVWKRYYGMSNVIVRISDGTNDSRADALLLNAHLDSTLPSPGAADDGAGVAIMLEVLRVLTMPGAPRVRHGVVLLFNNGEESLQDASHLYMTQDALTKDTVRAVINLEACGVSGPTLLFQATDAHLIQAYAHVPHPFGTVLASDVFSSGVIMSDTDFRQFVEYGHGLPGLDMAIVGSSYLYHTRRDTPAYMEQGVVQHFGENVLSLIESLALDAASPLPQIRPWPYAFKPVLPVYFSLFGHYFVHISPKLFKNMITALAVALNFYLSSINSSERRVSFMSISMLSSMALVLSYVAAIVAANGVAAALRAIGTPLSWFGHEAYAAVLFGPPVVAALIGVQMVLHGRIEASRRPYLEYTSFSGAAVIYTLGMLLMNYFRLGSAYMMMLAMLTVFVPIVVNDLGLQGLGRIATDGIAPDQRVHFATYMLTLVPVMTLGFEGMISFLDLIVPLMGRMGTDVPVDHVIASLVAFLVTLNSSAWVPLCHRYGLRFMRTSLGIFVALSVAMLAFFALPAVPTFDELHPRRLLVHHVENITSGEWHVAYTTLDSAARDTALDARLRDVLLHGEANGTLSWDIASQASPDMDVLFPLTHFIQPTRLTLPATPERRAAAHDAARWHDVRLSCEELRLDLANGTRTVRMRLEHPGLAWSTLSFDADVLAWDFPATPPQGLQRHHLKDVSRLGHDTFEVQLTMRVPTSYVTPQPLADTRVLSPPAHAATVRDPAPVDASS